MINDWYYVIRDAEDHKKKYPTFDLTRFLNWFQSQSLQDKTVLSKRSMAQRVKTMKQSLSISRLAEKE